MDFSIQNKIKPLLVYIQLILWFMKIVMKATLLLWLATLSCPCELTGHQFCSHATPEITLNNRKEIKKLRQKSKSIPKQLDSLETLTLVK